MNLVVSICVGVAAGIAYGILRRYMDKNNLVFNWDNIKRALFILFAIWFIYSTIGVIFADTYVKDNGNVCKGFPYGFKICSGDINKE